MTSVHSALGRNSLALVLILSMAKPSAAQDERPIIERYSFNAQYRGGVKKGFSDIGNGSVAFHPLAENEFRVRLKGSVRHPENREIYSLELSMWFRLEGATVVVVREDNQYNERAKEYRDRVEKVVPFLYLVKFFPVPASGQEPTRRFRYRDREFIIRYVRTPKHFEATVYEKDSVVAKFFILQSPREAPLVFEKFRIPAEADLMLSFVRQAS